MNTKILISLVTIGLVASVVGVGTYAYFSDTETSSGNTLTGGVLNLKVNGHDGCPGCTVVTVGDLKPSFTRYSNDIVLEINDNPGKLYKRIKGIECLANVLTEPEAVEESGCPKQDLDKYTWFDLEKWNGADWDVVIPDNLVTIEDMVGKWIYLGEYLPVPNQLKIRQSFHLKSSVTNWAQGDQCVFTEEFMVNQVNAPDPDNCWNCPLILENKDDKYWFILDDETAGVLNFLPKGPKFLYDLDAKGLMPTTEYDLIYYADGWPGNNPGALIAHGWSDGSGQLSISGEVELGMDLPTLPDTNHPGAKIWLVPASDYDEVLHKMTAWKHVDYLFEYRLIQYDDTEVP